jgi:Secreted repeat of unknown function
MSGFSVNDLYTCWLVVRKLNEWLSRRNSGLAIRHFFRPLRNIRGVRWFIGRMGYARSICEDKPVGDLTIIKRTGAALQWGDGGKPLYTFANDKKPGDVTGDNKNNVWHIVKED